MSIEHLLLGLMCVLVVVQIWTINYQQKLIDDMMTIILERHEDD